MKASSISVLHIKKLFASEIFKNLDVLTLMVIFVVPNVGSMSVTFSSAFKLFKFHQPKANGRNEERNVYHDQ